MQHIDGHDWLLDSGLVDAGCITVMVGLDKTSALAAFRADASRTVPIADAYGYEEGDDEDSAETGNSFVSVADVPGGVVAFEFNGFQGSRREVMTVASARGSSCQLVLERRGRQRLHLC